MFFLRRFMAFVLLTLFLIGCGSSSHHSSNQEDNSLDANSSLIVVLDSSNNSNNQIDENITSINEVQDDNITGDKNTTVVQNGDENSNWYVEPSDSDNQDTNNNVNVISVISVTPTPINIEDDVDSEEFDEDDNNSNEIITDTDEEDDEDNTTIVTPIRGHFIDSPVEGISYICDGELRVTDSNGTFECISPPITFKLGDLTLGVLEEFTADGRVYPQDLLGIPRDNFTYKGLKLFARLIQSLDDDGNISENILIEEDIAEQITIDRYIGEMQEEEVRELVESLGKVFIEECIALKHLGANVKCNSDGSYDLSSDFDENDKNSTDTPSIPTPTPLPTPEVTPVKDTIPPVIILNGMRKISIYKGDEYKELGARAEDNVDGNLTSKIVITGKVDTTKVGKYEIKYSVKDRAGNEASVIRVVQVKDRRDVISPIIIPTSTPTPTPTSTPTPTPTSTPTSTPTPTPTPTPTSTPIPTQTLNNIKNNFQIVLQTIDAIAGYEVYLKFTDDTPDSLIIDNSFLGKNGRNVVDLGPDINKSTKEVKFGGFSYGTQEGVSGEFNIANFTTADNKDEIFIIKKSCVDKDANDVDCNIEIK